MTRKMWWWLVLGLAIVIGLFLASRAMAQDKPVEPTDTKEQALTLENFTLREQRDQTQMALLQQAAEKLAEVMQRNRADKEAYIQAMEQAHPGWVKNRTTLKWERASAPPPAKK